MPLTERRRDNVIVTEETRKFSPDQGTMVDEVRKVTTAYLIQPLICYQRWLTAALWRQKRVPLGSRDKLSKIS